MKKKYLSILGAGLFIFGTVGMAEATAIVAYDVPVGTSGNQEDYSGFLGMDFNVLEDIKITSLGVFDDQSDGLFLSISVSLYERTQWSTPLAQITFPIGDTGTLVGGSRFMDLATTLTLSTGFQGSIVARGYGTGEKNGNLASDVPWTTNDGGGLLEFVGDGRYGMHFPTNIDGGPANRYAAGTFQYEAATPVPIPATMLLLGTGLAGLVGTGIKRRKNKK